jgi:hypothetical protein
LIEKFGIEISDPKKLELADKRILKSLHWDKETQKENLRRLEDNLTERSKIVKEIDESNYGRRRDSDFQDTTDITGETEPFDPMDLDG